MRIFKNGFKISLALPVIMGLFGLWSAAAVGYEPDWIETQTSSKPSTSNTEAIKPLTSPGLMLNQSIAQTSIVIISQAVVDKAVANAPTDSSKKVLAGVQVDVPSFPKSVWEHLTGPDGRRSWRIAIKSPGAMFTRLHFASFSVAKSDYVLVYASPNDSNPRSVEPTKTATTPDFWGPSIQGELVYVEVVTQSNVPPDIVIDQLAHGIKQLGGELEKIGNCYLDPTCFSEWADAEEAVGRYIFQANGSWYYCTGTLVMDTKSTYKPWFISANHCISTEASADTIEVTWFFHTSACNGSPPNEYNLPKTHGSKLKFTSNQMDMTLLLLDSDPPNDAVYMGWSTQQLSSGDPITVLHHPGGTYMRISFGALTSTPAGDSFPDLNNFWYVNYTQSSTEPGSSGSGLLNSDKKLIGTLSAGNAACDYMGGYDMFGKLSAAWSKGVSNYLGDGTGGDDDVSDDDFFNPTDFGDDDESSRDSGANGSGGCGCF